MNVELPSETLCQALKLSNAAKALKSVIIELLPEYGIRIVTLIITTQIEVEIDKGQCSVWNVPKAMNLSCQWRQLEEMFKMSRSGSVLCMSTENVDRYDTVKVVVQQKRSIVLQMMQEAEAWPVLGERDELGLSLVMNVPTKELMEELGIITFSAEGSTIEVRVVNSQLCLKTVPNNLSAEFSEKSVQVDNVQITQNNGYDSSADAVLVSRENLASLNVFASVSDVCEFGLSSRMCFVRMVGTALRVTAYIALKREFDVV